MDSTKNNKHKKCFYKNEIYSLMLKFIILSKLKKHKLYAYNILKDLKQNQMLKKHFNLDDEKIKNDVYNTIKSLENSNYIKLFSSTKNKNYYELTKKGSDILASIKEIFIKTTKRIQKIIK